MNCPKFLDTTKARIEEEHQTQRGHDTMEPKWNPDRGGMAATGANSKQIQAVKATVVKAHRQRNATKETDDTNGCRRPDDEIATVRCR
ncbi:hypothetical protein S83_021095 [Arachis hypogaea]